MNALSHQEIIVAPLASGSRGNCTYIGDGKRGVLVDCGLSTRQVLRRLDALGLSDTRIEAVLITHEHTDHVGAARILDDKLQKLQGRRVPFYLTPGTAEGLNPRCTPKTLRPIQSGRAFLAAPGVQVEPLTIPHDTLDPVCFTVEMHGVRVGVVTDLGRSTPLVEQQLGSLDIAVVEFNHDTEMLLEGRYPWPLKQRVRGNHGHLSNAQAAALVSRGISPRLRHLVLAHLSEENNDPQLALRAAGEALHAAGVRGVGIHVASQDTPIGPLRAPPRQPKAPAAPRARPAPSPPEPELQICLFPPSPRPPLP